MENLSNEELNKLMALADNATPGPWYWDIRPLNKSLELVGAYMNTVLRPIRWGFNGASLYMPDQAEKGILSGIHEDAVAGKGREHHANWHRVPVRDNAAFIAAANPDTVKRLALELQRLRATTPTPPAPVEAGGEVDVMALFQDALEEWAEDADLEKTSEQDAADLLLQLGCAGLSVLPTSYILELHRRAGIAAPAPTETREEGGL